MSNLSSLTETVFIKGVFEMLTVLQMMTNVPYFLVDKSQIPHCVYQYLMPALDL